MAQQPIEKVIAVEPKVEPVVKPTEVKTGKEPKVVIVNGTKYEDF